MEVKKNQIQEALEMAFWDAKERNIISKYANMEKLYNKFYVIIDNQKSNTNGIIF